MHYFDILYPIQTGHIMHILSPLNSQRMRILCPVCQGYKSILCVNALLPGTDLDLNLTLIPLTDWAQNAHSLTVQRGQNAHYVPGL